MRLSAWDHLLRMMGAYRHTGSVSEQVARLAMVNEG
jgi:hypothetical protein